MLKSVRLKNFKLHEDTLIEAAPITVFIGPNNSGKSSIFQALLLVRQAASRNDRLLCQSSAGEIPPQEPYEYSPQRAIDLGRFEEIRGRGGSDIHVGISGVVRPGTSVVAIEEVSVSAHLQLRDNQLASHDGSVEVSGTKASWRFVRGAPSQNANLSLGEVRYVLQVLDTFQLTGPWGYSVARPETNPETLLSYNETSGLLSATPSKLLASLHPVYALRGFEEWGYPITDYPPAAMELLTLHDRAIALPNALASDLGLKKRLSDRLEELLHVSIDFELVPGKRLKIWAKPSANKAGRTLFVNEGTGASQIPFILVPVLLTPPNETVLLSEPEVHLHPKGQCELTRMLLTVAKKENIQFFIETHSEHVLHVVLNAIAKHEWEPSQVAIYSFENVNGTAKATRLEVDEQGGVKDGLPGFFDQSLDELTEYLDALKKPTA
jgi:energy-coupling factor transporter ATP-binding protein EcfA2